MEAPPTTELVAGKYQLLGMIGRGGMGSVWEGRHITLGTRVAIKFIETDHASSVEARQRFDNEARAAATIQSKYAIQIFDHGVLADGKPYIVMEFLSGEPLDKRLERLRALPLQDAAHILHQVAKGLGRAHERGIIHRDLKPENIFLVRDEDEGGEIAKVLDFGIAKMTSDSMAISNSTKTGAILGTPYYMSPEQARGLKNIDHRSDIWSFAVIAFRCVTGRLPFDGESVGDLLVKICVSPLPRPSEINPNLPQTFDGWFSRCLDREPMNRFPTVQEASMSLLQLSGITGRGSFNSGQLQAVQSPSHGGRAQDTGQRLSPSMPIPQYAPVYTPSPYSGTPLPAARATSAGLSSSTSGAQPRSNRGILVAIAGIFLLLGIGATVLVVAKFRDKPVVTTGTIPLPDPTPAVSTVSAGATTATEVATLTLLSTGSSTTTTAAGAGTATTKRPNLPVGPKTTATAPTAKTTASVPVPLSTKAGF
jgi:eukaryotic-like serine/threonine-protein kinase